MAARLGDESRVPGQGISQGQAQYQHQGAMAMVAGVSCPAAHRTWGTTKHQEREQG